MKIRFGFDITCELPAPTSLVLLLHIRPELAPTLRAPQALQISREIPAENFIDNFGNLATRLDAPAGALHLTLDSACEVSGELDERDASAAQHDIADLPGYTLPYLLPSRYCETDLLSSFAWAHFGHIPPGWERVHAVCSYVHQHLRFNYRQARPTRSAYEAWQEKIGVCRDFAHLAITLCRCLNIPARYATGYLGDIGVPADPGPMDFSAWFEIYLGGRWFTADARHNKRRIGRIVMARGRDAADCAFITSFGRHYLREFKVITDEIPLLTPELTVA